MGFGRKYSVFFAKMIFAAVALGLMIYISDLESIKIALRKANYYFIGAGVCVFLLGQYVASQRWHYVLRTQGIVVTRTETWKLTQIGTLFGNFLPGQGSGDLVKVAFLFPRFPTQKEKLMASIIYDRILGLLAIVSLAVIIFFCVLGEVGFFPSMNVPASHMLSVIGITLIVIILLLRSEIIKNLIKKIIGKRISVFIHQLGALFSSGKLFMCAFAASLVFQGAWILSAWLMFCAIQPSTSLFAVMFSVPLSVLAASIPLTLGGVGIREGSLSFLMQQSDMSASVATAGALLTLVPLLVSSILGGVLLLLKRSH